MKKMKNPRWTIVVLLAGLLFLSACNTTPSSDQVVSDMVNKQQSHYLKVQPMPWFDYSLPLYLMNKLYVSQNNAVNTYAYMWNQYLGQIDWQCDSIGYPIPGGTQIDNPWQVYNNNGYHYGVAIGQAEPNGLYPPATSAGTYVMCLNPDGTIAPVYQEPSVTASPFRMIEQNRRLVRDPNSKSSIGFAYDQQSIIDQGKKDAASVPTESPK